MRNEAHSIGPQTSSSPSSTTKEQIVRELLRRRRAIESLIAFTEYTFERYRTAPHHRKIAEQLERVERGELDRLMLLTAPRHGKSKLASCRSGPAPRAMSALPLRTDMLSAGIDVCLVPIADRSARQVIPCSSPPRKSGHRPSCRRWSSPAACLSQGEATSKWSLLSFPRWHSP